MSRRAGLLLLGVLVLAFGAGLAIVVATRGPACPVELTLLEQDTPELVPADDLTPEGTVGEERQPILNALAGLGGPFGDVVAGRFYAAGETVPVLVPFGDDVVLADPGQDSGDFLAVDLPEGRVRWGRAYDGGAARGGLVGDAFVVLVGGASPAVVTLDPEDGDEVACLAAPVSGSPGAVTTLLTDQAETDVVVVAGPPAAEVTMSRVAPADGELRWEQQLDGVAEAGSVTVVGDTVVVGRIGADPVRLADMAAAGGIAAPMVTAYSLADGSEAWSHPLAADAAGTAALVVGNVSETGTLVLLTAEPGRSPSSKATVARLKALDADGTELWSTRLGEGFWNASLWGDVVVTQGADPAGGAQLRAYSAADGEPQWTLGASTLPSLGAQPRTNFGTGVAVGEQYVVPAPNGLVLLDPATGDVDRLDSSVAVQQVFVAGEHLLLTTEEALLVLDAV
jgi:outer membrane protein assembly factor BamB